ncbi:galactose-binding domain-containing protein [Paenibacillus arenilitoris]|uniref:Discoidin domain-containing protein n=1 Tax=Paenibacillus arenilitoris TaxID=2772299 RepID=A0A927CG74_9BACL|nr:discoidin domain-containing protein [Paenibacillus arenilitoris]MBD2866970.1 discoidin domain-containing protein [Paenibacillus arenilitoris]
MRRPMGSTLAYLLLVIAVMAAGIGPMGAQAATGTTYYVDDVDGNDANAGTSPAAAWKSLEQLNATTFQPGDAILFKAGGVWSGQLHAKGSGADGSPITIDKYGDGPKPLLNGGGVDATIYFNNQEYWEVRNLEITNYEAEAGQRRGIHVTGVSNGWSNPEKVFRHFVFEYLDIHSVKGSVANDYAHNGGIVVWDPSWNFIVSDVIIRNNKIYSLDSVGIYLNGATSAHSSNLQVVNNTIYDIAADGAVLLNTTDGLIENNVVYDTHKRASGYHVPLWTWGTRNAVIQYNEVFNTHPGGDAMAIDSDYNSEGTVIQYNYSHRNAGGFSLVVNDGTNASNFNTDTVIRYNISQNDYHGVFNFVGPTEHTLVYNNTVYIPEYSNTKVVDNLNWNGWSADYHFYNNLLVNHGTGGYNFGSSTNYTFDRNLFHGNHPADVLTMDANKVVADPMLASPGSAAIGRSTTAGYQLLQGSPAIGAGRIVASNGGLDFWGNPVSANTAPNIGAYEGAGLDPNNLPPLPQPPELANLLVNSGFEAGDFAGYPTAYNGAAVVSGQSRTGQYAASLSNAVSGIEQAVTGLAPNTLYVLSGFGKQANGGDAVLGVKEYGGALKDVKFDSTHYSKKELTFTTGNDDTSAIVYLYKNGGTGTVYFDDLVLYEYGEVLPLAEPPALPPPGLQNLAPLAALSASSYRVNSTAEFTPDKAVNGIKDNNADRWLTEVDATAPHWLQMEWEQPYEINVVRIWSGLIGGGSISSTLADYEIQYWDGTGWRTAASVVGNTKYYNHFVIHPVTTDKVRLWITKATATDNTARVFEMEVWEHDENADNPDPVDVSSITVKGTGGASSIHEIGGTLQMMATVSPADAVNKSVTWSVTDEDGGPTDAATISTTGLLTALAPGTVKVHAAAKDGSGVQGESTIVIAIPDPTHTNIAPLAELAVSSTHATQTADKAVDGIKDQNASRWLSEPGVPEPHTFQLTWSENQVIDRVKVWSGIIGGTGSRLQDYEIQYWDGSAWQTAASVVGNTQDGHLGQYNDLVFPAVTTDSLRMYITKAGSGSSTARVFEIEAWGKAAVPVSSIAVSGAGGISEINGIGGTLQMDAAVSPAGATDPSVTWSVYGEDGGATEAASISSTGLLTANAAGIVKVVAMANDGSGVSGESLVTITVSEPENANIAPLAQVSASSVRTDGSFPPEYAVDGIKNNNASRWLSAGGDTPPYTFDLEWNSQYVIDNVKVWSGFVTGGSAIAGYEIQYWNGSDWATAASVTGNTTTMNNLEFPAVTTNKMRLYITKPAPSSSETTVRLIEMEAWGYEA